MLNNLPILSTGGRSGQGGRFGSDVRTIISLTSSKVHEYNAGLDEMKIR